MPTDATTHPPGMGPPGRRDVILALLRSAAEPRSLLTTEPIAGRPPSDCRSLKSNPDMHWKASCRLAEPTSERIHTSLWAIAASLGMCSHNWNPGIVV